MPSKMESNKRHFFGISLFVLVMNMLVVGSSAFSSTVFDSSTNNQWAQDMCASNTTCAENAQNCFSQLRKARWFLESLGSSSSSPASLAERCQLKRDEFDSCATQANLNATWSSITGSDLSCEQSFLRRRPNFQRRPLHHGFRPRRTLQLYTSRFFLPRSVHHERFEGPFRRSARDLGRRGFGRGGWHGPRSSPHGRRGGWRRVEAFLETLEQTNLVAFQSFTECTLEQENLLTDTGAVNRTTFDVLASVAFAAEAQVLLDVRDALQTCSEPALPQLEDYMKCWATACVKSKLT